MIDWTKPELLQARKGNKVLRVLATDLKGYFPVCLEVDGIDGALMVTMDGRHRTIVNGESDFDIIPLPRKHKIKCYMYRSPSGGVFVSDNRGFSCFDDYVVLDTFEHEFTEKP